MEGDQPKKKRVRKKPGRYKLQNCRVAQREAMARQRENQEGSEDGSEEEDSPEVEQFRMLSLGSTGPQHPGVKNEGNAFYAAFLFLSKNLVFKKVVPAQMPRNPKRATYLSRKLVQLLRWDLPKSKISFLAQDGSAEIEAVAKYFGILVDDVKEAAFSEGGKQRVVMFELISYGMTETRISALGGHGFRVFTPPGHRLVPFMTSKKHEISLLYHETAAVKAIKTANQLSSMDRAGGINFHPKVAGGYRPNADHDMVIGEFQLNQALVDGFVFFENHFSGLVFGLGKWKQDKGWWDGVIPLRYVEIKPRDPGQ